MALSGDLRNIKLADIFQTLSMNRQVGIVVLRNGSVEKRLYFSREGVSLFSRRTIAGFRLGRHLVGAGKITEDQLRQALAHQEKYKGLLGEILVEIGFCQAEDIEQIIRYHVAEEIYDLFAWESGTFEFLEADGSEASPEAAAFSTVSFDPGGVVMEAARRIDEWDRIRLALPDQGAVLVRTGEEGPTLDQAVWGYDSAAVYGLVDGLRTASEILEDYYLATFETASILAELVRENLIRMATDTELADAGNGFFEQSEWRRAIQFLERARPLRPEDARLIERLAVCHEAVGARREAAEALVALASLRAVRMETADAINILERAAGLDPASPAAPQLLMGLYRDVGDGARAAACAARAGEIYLSQGRADVAEDTCRHVLELAPDDIALRSVLANACLALSDVPAAIEHLTAISASAEARGDLQKFSEVAGKILQLDPGRREVAARLEILAENRRRKRRRLMTAAAGGGVVFAGLLGAALLFFTGGAGAEERLGLAWRLLQKGDLRGAESIAQAVIAEDRDSDAVSQARNLLNAANRRQDLTAQGAGPERRDIETALSERFAPVRNAFGAREWTSGFDQGVSFVEALSGTELSAVIAKLPKKDAQKVRDDCRRDVRAILDLYTQHLEAELQRSLTRMWPVKQAREKKLTPGERSELCLAAGRLMTEIAPDELRRNLASAEVIELAIMAGERKLSDRIAHLSSAMIDLHSEVTDDYHRLRAPLRRDELFQSFTAVRQSVAEHLMQGHLEKAREVSLAFLSACRELADEQPAEIYAPVIREILGDDSLDLDGKVRRDFDTIEQVLERISSGEALVAQGRLEEANDMFLGVVREHYRLNLRSRVRLAIRIRTAPMSAAVRLTRQGEPDQDLGLCGPLGILARYPCWGVTILAASQPTFRSAVFNLEVGAEGCPPEVTLALEKVPSWVSAESGPIQASPVSWRDAILVPSRDGHLRAFAQADGRLVLDHDTDLLPGLAGTPLVIGDKAVLLAPDTKVVAFDLASGRRGFAFGTDHAIRSDPIQFSDLVVVADESGKVCGLRDGREVWKSEIAGPVKVRPAACSEAIYLGTTESTVHCLDGRTGQLRWERNVDAPVFTPLSVHEELVLVGTEASELIALSRQNGQVVWRHQAENAIRGRVACREGVVFAATLAGTILRLDAASGRPLAGYTNLSGQAFESGVTLTAAGFCAVDAAGVLHLLDGEAKLRWTFALGGPSRSEPLCIGSRLFVATESGRIHALDEGP
ncbi:MAG: PQQ-binding-like beta-propeller repeat protein [Planctomycetes bacterium]|jgi:outer membrane protein assembly factor BamB/tetratricopeptide (TPR) repeat protein|nr:PQQ-binding-like beta-propeller repeat protein [Planctomycetota bacterium]